MADAAAALRGAAAWFADVSASPRLDAELLMAHAAGMRREDLLLRLCDIAVPDGFAALVARRAGGEPVAYILGYRDFWSVRIAVAPGVLIPRADSETLIEAALEACGEIGPKTVLDLGCGPGTLLCAALDRWPDAHGVGVERSTVARAQAEANVATLGQSARARIVAGDWTRTGWVADIGARFDLVLCNPPYVESAAELAREVAAFEPGEALFAGADGLADYRLIVPYLTLLLTPGGVAVIELGAGQAAAVADIAATAGLTAATRRDLGGHMRALILRVDEATR